MDKVLNALKKGKTEEEAFKLIKKDPLIKIYWMKKGLSGEEPYKYFLNEITKISVQNEYKKTFKDKNSNAYHLIEEEKEEEYSEIHKYDFSKERLDLIIKSLKEDIELETALKMVNVPSNSIDIWIEEALQGNLPFRKYYKNLIELRELQKDKKEKDEEEIKYEVIKLIKDGYGLNDASFLVNNGKNKDEIIHWFNLGRNRNKKYEKFFDEVYDTLNQQRPSEKIKIYTKDDILNKKINIFINTLEIKKEEEIAFDEADVNFIDVENWCELAKENQDNYRDFLYVYKRIIRNLIPKNEVDYFKNKNTQKHIGNFLDNIDDGKSIKNSLNYKVTSEKFVLWKKYGSLNIKPFKEFFEKYEETKENLLQEKLHNIRVQKINEGIENNQSLKQIDGEVNKLISLKEEEFRNKYIQMERDIQIEFYNIRAEEENEEFIDENMTKEINSNKKDVIDKLPESDTEKIKVYGNEFINLYKLGYSQHLALEKSNLSKNEIDKWIKLGKNNINPYEKFYINYLAAKVENTEKLKEYNNLKINRENFLDKIMRYDEDKALKMSNLTNKQISEWKEKGEIGIYPYIKFNMEYKKIEETKSEYLYEFNKFEDEINIFINEIKKGQTITKAKNNSELTLKQINKWKKLGEDGIKPWDKFSIDYNRAISYQEFKLEEYSKNKERQEVFIELMEEDKDIEYALNKSNLTEEEIDEWYVKGKEKISPYDEFYKKYEKVKKDNRKNLREYKKFNKIKEMFLSEIMNNKPLRVACEKCELDINEVEKWLIKGSEGKKPYDEFYKEYQDAKKYYLKNKKEDSLKLNVIEKQKENVLITISGKTDKNSKKLENILKTFNEEIYKTKIEPFGPNKVSVLIELKIKEDSLNFIKSLININ